MIPSKPVTQKFEEIILTFLDRHPAYVVRDLHVELVNYFASQLKQLETQLTETQHQYLCELKDYYQSESERVVKGITVPDYDQQLEVISSDAESADNDSSKDDQQEIRNEEQEPLEGSKITIDLQEEEEVVGG